MNKLKLILVFLVLLIIVAGCSNTVTQLLPFGDELLVRVTFRENIDYVNNRYFMVISTPEAPSIPLGPPDSLDEFLEPGAQPQIGDLQDYYDNYFSTWHSYIILDASGFSLGKGPFIVNTQPTKETFQFAAGDTSEIQFNISLARIFGNNLPERFYFDIVSVDYPSGGAKYLKDKISPPDHYIVINQGAVVSQSDEENTSISGSLDILDWEVKIE
jgi:hypothetical protein